VDLDSDGNLDILSGSYSRQEPEMAGLFQVLWRRPDGTFKKAEALDGTDSKPLIIPVQGKPGDGEDWIKNICTRPFAVDWDGDGQLDLVVGNFPGTFYLFKGEGKGKFAPVPEEMKTGDGVSLKVEGNHSDPFVIDWDRDGDLDLLSGSGHGGVQWAENRSGPGKPPQLAQFKILIQAGAHGEFGQILKEADIKGPLSSLRIWVDDYDGDGKLDILVGDLANLLSPADNVTEGQFKERLSVWNKSLQEASQKMNEAKEEKDRTAAIERVQKLYAERSQFMKEDYTGFVWLYLQK
jgi:hypothetical protein